jgi:CBS domain-containing protein
MTIGRITADRGSEVWTISADRTVAEAVALLAEKRIGALPVSDGKGGVAGIFSERDVLYCLNAHGAGALSLKVSDAMTAPVVTVDPGTPVLEALSLMTRRRIRHLPVVEGERMVAFVSIGDLVKHRLDSVQAEAEAMLAYIQTA